jgi:hypothetical protein
MRGQDSSRDILDAEQRLRRWEANKHKHPNNTDWWRDFYLSPGHAETKVEAQDLIRQATDNVATKELEARREAEENAKRCEVIDQSQEARASRRADGLRILSLNVGHLGVVFLGLYSVFRLAGREGLPVLDLLWGLSLFVTPLSYVTAVVSTFRATSLWERAQRHGRGM